MVDDILYTVGDRMEDSNLNELEQQGYEVVGDFEIPMDGMTMISLTKGQVKQATAMKQRHDKMVVVHDQIGTMAKASSLLFGYNKKGIKLADGDYISAPELLQAILDAVANLREGTMVVSRKGEPLNPESLLATLKEVAGAVIVREKLPNGNQYRWSVKGAESGPTVSKGIAMVGNKIVLGNGDYLSADEILKALNDYVIVEKKEKEPPIAPIPPMPPVPPVPEPNPRPEPNPAPEPNPRPDPGLEPEPGLDPGPDSRLEPEPRKTDEQTHTVRVVRKYKNRLSAWLAALAISLVLISGLGQTTITSTVRVPEPITEQIVQIVTKEDLGYDISGIDYEGLSPEEAILKQVMAHMNMGDYARVEDGDVLTTRGNLTGVAKEMGKEFTLEGKQAGDYAITGIAIVHDGKMIDYIESFNLEDTTTNLADYVMKVCNEHGLSLGDIEINIHMGSNTERTRLGWIDGSSIFKEQELTEQAIQEIIDKGATYQGTVEDFKGDSITLDNGVTIKVKDDSGNLLQSGTHVIGSDGSEYVISDLSIEQKTEQKITEATHTIMHEEEIVEGTKMTWRIQDCKLSLAIAPLVGSLAAAVATKKKNEEENKHPQFYEFEDESEYLKFREEFIRNGEEYRKNSSFGKMLKRIFYRKEEDVMQNLTEEQVREVYHFVRSLKTIDYSYQGTDHITMSEGRIFAEKVDGTTIDITDIVMPYIADIGSKNAVAAEGRLEREEDGTKQR